MSYIYIRLADTNSQPTMDSGVLPSRSLLAIGFPSWAVESDVRPLFNRYGYLVVSYLVCLYDMSCRDSKVWLWVEPYLTDVYLITESVAG